MSHPSEGSDDVADFLSSGYWEEHYRQGRTGWDRGGPTPQFEALLAETDAPRPGTMAVVGCGNGHDALLFARHGFDVTGFDFAPTPLANATAAAAASGLQDHARFERIDIFDLADRYPGSFDYVLERACFTAIAPADRDRYVRVVHDILKPGGLLIGQFMLGEREGGPPFATSPAEFRQRFTPGFTVERLEQGQDSDGPMTPTLALLRRK